jgi:murein DD-endopeptidase MepM/ murein hydrolase activator NlpD
MLALAVSRKFMMIVRIALVLLLIFASTLAAQAQDLPFLGEHETDFPFLADSEPINDYKPGSDTLILDGVPGTMNLRVRDGVRLNLRVAPVFSRRDVAPGLELSDYVIRVLEPGTNLHVLQNYGRYYQVAAPYRSGSTIQYQVGYVYKSDRYLRYFRPSADEVNNPGVPGAVPEGNFPTTGELVHPLCGCDHARCRVTSPYGWRRLRRERRARMHWGVDFAGPIGTPVRAVADGFVSETSCGSGYGRCLIINHRRTLRESDGDVVSRAGFQTLYSHLSRKLVSPGDIVEAGQVIALQGASGYVTGPNTHFEIRANGERLNPTRFFSSGSIDRGSRYPACPTTAETRFPEATVR